MDQAHAEALPQQIARDEYRNWAARQPRGRYERVWRRVVRMSPERLDHIRVKMRVWQALDRAVREADIACEALGDGATVEIGDHTDYEPDAVVTRGPPSPGASVVAPDPVIVVEVASPSTEAVDAGAKLADYFRVPSIRHYLIVRIEPREVIHHFRSGERIEAQIRDSGALLLDPPGLTVMVEDLFRDLPPRTA
jgi:Uma2 family endonuclease